MKENKKQIVIATSILVVTTILLLGLTYAYYKTRINGNTKDKSISVTSKKLEITYSDGNGVIEGTGIEPGYTTTKTFTVENTGDEVVNYSIKLDNVTNTFLRIEDWTYVLKKGDVEVSSGTIPNSETYIVNAASIDPKTTDSYSLTVTYANLSDVDQSVDMGKSLSIRVNIDEVVETIFENASEGTLLRTIGKDNLISKPLTQPGEASSGEGIFKEVVSDVNSTSNFSDTNGYIVYGTGYVLDENTGKYNLTGVQVKKFNEVYNDLEGCYVSGYRFRLIDSTAENKTKVYRENISIISKIGSSTENSLTYDTKYSSERTYFYEGMFASTEDDYGMSYYYRGRVNNNYVNFARMCWRIVRVQGDGNIKVVLADESDVCNGSNYKKGTITESVYSGIIGSEDNNFVFNSGESSDATVLDFSNSDILKVLNTWLSGGEVTVGDKTSSFVKKIDETKLVDAEWCVDFSIADNSTDSIFNYGGYNRIYNRKGATLKCNLSGKSESKSKKIASKIGILTADEAAFAGLAYDSNSDWQFLNSYLIEDGDSFWTTSPAIYAEGISKTMLIVGPFSLESAAINAKQYIRPVIVFDKGVQITSGNGTQSNPYVVE